LPTLKLTKSKKTLNYITLIITFLISIYRLVTAVTMALNNTFTLNFGLNVSITLLITGSIFFYYLYEVRYERSPAPFSRYLIATIVLGLISIITLGLGFYLRTAAYISNPPDIFSYNDPHGFTPSQSNYPTPTPTPEPTVINSISQSVDVGTLQGIKVSISAARITQTSPPQVLLELDIVFTGAQSCPVPSGMCGGNRLGFKITDQNNLVLERTIIDDQNSLREVTLKPGEKNTGKVFFIVKNPSEYFNITYNATSGETSKPQKITFPIDPQSALFTSP